MCRFALYVGPRRPLAITLFDPPRSLAVLARDPRELVRGTVNVDGTGVAWWPEAGEPPLRYATPQPPWSDPNLAGLAARLNAPVHLAAVRSATPGIPFGAPAVAPFVEGGLAFAHNGWIDGFRGAVGRRLLERLPDDAFRVATEISSDSRAVFGAVLAHRGVADGLREATVTALREVAGVVAAAGSRAALNVAVCDGTEAVVTRTSVDDEHNSLYVLEDAGAFQGARVVSSEALDPSLDWTPVPPGCLVHVTREGLEVLELTLT